LEVTIPNSWALKIVRGAMRDDPEIKAFEVRNARPNDWGLRLELASPAAVVEPVGSHRPRLGLHPVWMAFLPMRVHRLLDELWSGHAPAGVAPVDLTAELNRRHLSSSDRPSGA
jgi:hypothetical protein